MKTEIYTVAEIAAALDALDATPVYWEGDEERGWNLWRSAELADRDFDIQIRPVWGVLDGGIEGYRVINGLTAPPRHDHLECIKLLY